MALWGPITSWGLGGASQVECNEAGGGEPRVDMTSGPADLICPERQLSSPHLQLRSEGQISIRHEELLQTDMGSSPTSTHHL